MVYCTNDELFWITGEHPNLSMVYCTITMFNFSQFDHIWELCHVNHAHVPSGNQTWLAMDNPNYIYI